MEKVKTPGIALTYIKYGDNGIISRIYTREKGMLPFLVRGAMKGGKTGSKMAFFQPFMSVQLEIEIKDTRNLQVIKEVHQRLPLYNLHTDFSKSTASLFLAELLSHTLIEGEPDLTLFEWLEDYLIELDQAEKVNSLHIDFLKKYAKILGFEDANFEKEDDGNLSKSERIEMWLNYFAKHIDGFRKPKSFQVLKDIMS